MKKIFICLFFVCACICKAEASSNCDLIDVADIEASYEFYIEEYSSDRNFMYTLCKVPRENFYIIILKVESKGLIFIPPVKPKQLAKVEKRIAQKKDTTEIWIKKINAKDYGFIESSINAFLGKNIKENVSTVVDGSLWCVSNVQDHKKSCYAVPSGSENVDMAQLLSVGDNLWSMFPKAILKK